MLRPDLTFVKLRLLIFYLEIRAATDLIVNLISKYQFSCLFYKVDLIVSRLKVFIEHGVVSDFFIYSRHRLFVTIFIFVPDHYPCIIAIVIGYKDAVGCLELGRFLGIILVRLGIIINRLSINILILIYVIDLQFFLDMVCNIGLIFLKQQWHIRSVSGKQVASCIILIGILLKNVRCIFP